MRDLPGLYAWQSGSSLERALRSPFLAAAAPGAGKTRFGTIWATLKIDEGSAKRIALIAPNALLRTTWPNEIKSYGPTSHLRLKATHTIRPAARFESMFDPNADIITITPDQLAGIANLIIEGKRCPFNAIIVDEAQGFREPTTAKTKALHLIRRCVPKNNLLLLSGSPSPNSSADLWSPGAMMSLYAPFWGESFNNWRNKHYRKTSAYGWSALKGTDERVRKEIAPFSVAVDLRDSTDVPREVFTTQPFDFGREHTDRINKFITEREVVIGDEKVVVDKDDDGRFLGLLRQLTAGFAYHPITHEAIWFDKSRIDALGDVLEQDPAPKLVAISFRAESEEISRRFDGVVRFDGETPMNARPGIVDRFNADRIPILCIAPASAGHGLNLQLGSARMVVWFSQGFSWEMKAQVEARLVRSGQKKVVSVVTLEANVGIDQSIAKVLARKSAGEKAVMAELRSKS